MKRVTNGELPPGSPLPSERALAEQFHVGRTSVREAMQGLVSLGLIERRGNGSYVTEHLPDVSVPAADERKDFVKLLFETRRVLELPIFELASFRASKHAREQIGALAKRFRDDMTLTEFRGLDRLFHTTIAAASGNRLLVELYGKVLDALFQSEAFHSLLYDRANEEGVSRIIARSGRQHRAIAEALLAGNPVTVLAAAESHLGSVEQQMVDDLV
jgi:GntR family transcriptional repressor for pyruvate dehydrogenase complex